jgi:hypothetical protein
MWAVPLFSYTLAFALQLRKSTENLSQGSNNIKYIYLAKSMTRILARTRQMRPTTSTRIHGFRINFESKQKTISEEK